MDSYIQLYTVTGMHAYIHTYMHKPPPACLPYHYRMPACKLADTVIYQGGRKVGGREVTKADSQYTYVCAIACVHAYIWAKMYLLLSPARVLGSGPSCSRSCVNLDSVLAGSPRLAVQELSAVSSFHVVFGSPAAIDNAGGASLPTVERTRSQGGKQSSVRGSARAPCYPYTIHIPCW